MKVDIQVDGLRHLEKLLTESLPAKAQTKVMVRALRRAGRPMVNSARSAYRAIGGSGALAQATSIWQRRKGVRGNTAGSVEIGPKRSNKAALSKYYQHYRKRATPKSLIGGVRHGHLVEFGFRSRAGRSVAGRGILGGVMDKHGRAVVDSFGAIMGREIEREAQRQALKQRPGR